MNEEREPESGPLALSRAGLCAVVDIERSSYEQDEVLMWALISAAWPSWRSLTQ